MIRVVLDTNVLASGALVSDSPVTRVIDAWLCDARFVVLVSEEMLDELDRAFRKPYFTRRLGPALREAYLALIRSAAFVIDVHTRVRGVATHPEDDAILATAVDGEANYLVTGDRALLALGSYRDVRIIRARELVELIADGAV